MRRRTTTGLDYLLLLIGAGLMIYVAAYFLVVRRAMTRKVTLAWTNATVFNPQPNYRGLPSGLFQPIHEVDRRFIRPKMWASWRVPLWDGSVHDPLNPKP